MIEEFVTLKLEEGEKEHCEDTRQAYAKTFAREEQFYDELAAKNSALLEKNANTK